jgi:hypothetical protein
MDGFLEKMPYFLLYFSGHSVILPLQKCNSAAPLVLYMLEVRQTFITFSRFYSYSSQ